MALNNCAFYDNIWYLIPYKLYLVGDSDKFVVVLIRSLLSNS